MKKVLVTGGAGFIGSWLCEELLNRNYLVVCIDNLCTGSEKNISHLKRNKNFEFIHHDIVRPLKEIRSRIDYIFHLASPASPQDYKKFSIETLLTNSQGTLNMLELARKKKARFLYTSTSEVYGNPLEHPQKESYWGNVNPNGPRSMYDESKRFAEALILAYYHRYDLNVRIARIFNTYGPKLKKNDGRVISNFINQALSGKLITIYGSGKQTRSFCYISDMISGLMKLMFISNLKGQIINLGNPNEKTILQIAKIIKELTGSSSEISFKPLPVDDPQRRCPDISKAKKLLGWEPQVNLKEGLQRTITWYKKVKKR
jgi:nucleoside-diphosphate-sugar epimerase